MSPLADMSRQASLTSRSWSSEQVAEKPPPTRTRKGLRQLHTVVANTCPGGSLWIIVGLVFSSKVANSASL